MALCPSLTAHLAFDSHPTIRTKDQGCKGPHFHVQHSLLIFTCVTRTSKNAVTLLDQNPPAFMSSLASGLVVVVLRSNLSVSMGCKRGSTSTFLQILLICKVNSSRMPSCLWATKPPLLHERAWPTVIRSSHAQWLGKSDSGKL